MLELLFFEKKKEKEKDGEEGNEENINNLEKHVLEFLVKGAFFIK